MYSLAFSPEAIHAIRVMTRAELERPLTAHLPVRREALEEIQATLRNVPEEKKR